MGLPDSSRLTRTADFSRVLKRKRIFNELVLGGEISSFDTSLKTRNLTYELGMPLAPWAYWIRANFSTGN